MVSAIWHGKPFYSHADFRREQGTVILTAAATTTTTTTNDNWNVTARLRIEAYTTVSESGGFLIIYIN